MREKIVIQIYMKMDSVCYGHHRHLIWKLNRGCECDCQLLYLEWADVQEGDYDQGTVNILTDQYIYTYINDKITMIKALSILSPNQSTN